MDLDKLLDGLTENEREPIEDAIDRLMGDEEMIIEFLVKFPENQNIIGMKKAVDARDAEASKNEAHSLKGLAASLGLLDLQDVCAEMVWDFRNEKPEEGFEMMEKVQMLFDKWVARIKDAQ